MATKSKMIIRISKCDISTSGSSNEINKPSLKHTKRKLELLMSDSADEITESSAICETGLQLHDTMVKKRAKSNIVTKLPDDKRNPTGDISQLADEMMFENMDSNLNDDSFLSLKLKSNFEVTKVTEKGTNTKISKRPEYAEIKSKVKATIKEDKLNEGVSETQVKLNKRNILKKNYSEETTKQTKNGTNAQIRKRPESTEIKSKVKGTVKKDDLNEGVSQTKLKLNKRNILIKNNSEETTKETPNQFNCDGGETSQSSLIKEASPRKTNTEQILDNPLSCILSDVITEIEDPECLQILSKHWIDKLKNVIKSAGKYKDRCGREILTADDFNKGLLFCEEKPILEYLDIPEEKKEEKIINILHVLKSKKRDDKVSILPKPKPYFNKAWLEHNPLCKDLSELPDELKVYFQLVTKIFLNPDESSCSAALEDLKINKNISYLVPSFVDFLSSEIKKKHSEFSSLSLTLRVIQSLLLNHCLHFAHDAIAYLLLKCLLDPLHHFHLNWDFRLVKDTAAELLALVLKGSKSKKLWFEIMFLLEASFCDLNKSFVSHYGAVAAVNSIGVSAITLVILPHIKDYFEHLNSVFSLFDYQRKCDVCAVQGQLIQTHYLLISHFVKYDFNESHSGETQSNPNDVLKRNIFEAVSKTYFSEYFGDALVQNFPVQRFASFSIADGKKIQNSILNAKYTGIKVKVQNKTRHWVASKVNTNKSKPDSELRDLMFDCTPLKKHAIKFRELVEKT